jgi:hypothetical protein
LAVGPDPGSGLVRRQESLPDAAVPQRAGAMVREFIGSIVEEADARAEEIKGAAESDAEADRRAAAARADVIRARIDAVGRELAVLRLYIARECDRLRTLPATGWRAEEAAEPAQLIAGSPGTGTGNRRREEDDAAEPESREGAEDARAGVEEAPGEVEEVQAQVEEVQAEDEAVPAARDRETAVAQVVEEEPGEAPAEVEEQNEDDASEPEARATETQTDVNHGRPDAGADGNEDGSGAAAVAEHRLAWRLAQMSDNDLATTFDQAMTSSRESGGTSEKDENYWSRLETAAVEEALKRVFFTRDQPRAGRRGLFGWRRQTEETPISRLRSAVRARAG